MENIDNIKSVSPEELSDVIENKKMDAGSEKLIQAEKEYINAWKEKNGREDNKGITGLALSGGGIRSATFSLGVMQALARQNKLAKFDYLSTVSGGGYIGSAITWLLNKKDKDNNFVFGVNNSNFPFGTEDPRPEKFNLEQEKTSSKQKKTAEKKDQTPPEKNTNSNIQSLLLNFVRQRANYLNPDEGISILALLGAVLRSSLLNLIVWFSVAVLFFISAFGISYLVNLNGFIENLYLLPGVSVFSDSINKPVIYLGFFDRLLYFGLIVVALLFLTMMVYSIATYFVRGNISSKIDSYYKIRFYLEETIPVVVVIAIILLIIGTIPIVGEFFRDKYSGSVGPIAVLSGSFFMLRSFFSAIKDKNVPIGLSVNVFSMIFLYGFVLVSFQTGAYIYGQFILPDRPLNYFIFVVCVLILFLLGFWVNLNYISIHRFYRDRLMETFMPDIEKVREENSSHVKAIEANRAYLKDFAVTNDKNNMQQEKAEPNSPYHIINTNLVLVNSKKSIYSYRGGDNFILSPLYCGSNATGWCPTKNYMNGKMTLATAVAISGAAVNPNTGVGGDGITRSKFLSFAMSLLNLRLGYWGHHPIKAPVRGKTPNHFRPGSYALGNLFGIKGDNENKPFLQLSDGGHFENTGIYELIRRKARLILACDGGEDHAFSFSDFQTTIRRVKDDFGATVSVDKNYKVDNVVPESQDLKYPPGGKFSDRGFILAKIIYSDDSEGLLIYLKTTMIKDVSFKVKGYKAQNPLFPDESTADQFFDEVQFEAYRELGYCIASQMIKELKGELEKYAF